MHDAVLVQVAEAARHSQCNLLALVMPAQGNRLCQTRVCRTLLPSLEVAPSHNPRGSISAPVKFVRASHHVIPNCCVQITSLHAHT